MADNFRIQIEDLEGTGKLKIKSQEDGKSKVLPEKEPSGTSAKDGHISGYNSQRPGNSAIELSSSASSLTFDASEHKKDTVVHTDIYSEQYVDEYGVSPSEARDIEMAALLGEAYGKIFNVESSDALTAAAIADLGPYENPITPADLTALARKMIYGQMKNVVSSEINAKGATSPSSNSGGNRGGSDDGYKNINEDGTNTSNPALRPIDLNIPISKLGAGENPYEDVLPSIDEVINELYEPEEPDYSDVDEDAGGVNADSNNGFNLKLKLPEFNIFQESMKTSLWDLRAMPDAMSNMFDVYFRIFDKDDDINGKHLDPGIDPVSGLFASKLLSARIQSIEIPTYERTTAQVTAWGQTLDRPTDDINTPGQSSFTIRADTRMLYIDFMNELSGTTMADYFGRGKATFGQKDKVKVSKTAEFLEKANKDVDDAYEKMQKEIENINKKNEDEIEAIRNAAVEDYKKANFDAEAQKMFVQAAAEKAEKEGISQAQAEAELMEEREANVISNLKKETKHLKELAASEADGYWAAQKEKRNMQKEINKVIKDIEKKTKERQKAVDDAMKEAAKAIKKAKKNKNKAVLNAYFRNTEAGAEINKPDTDIVAYVTGAIARNMSVRFCGAPLTSLDNLKDHMRVDIIVKRVAPGHTFRSVASPKKDERFIFEDVKLLGTSTPISFKRDTADPVDFSYSFIYKRFYKLDYYADNAQDWIKSQMDFYADKAVSLALDKMFGRK